MGYPELRSMLCHYIGAIFDNESEFFETFFPDVANDMEVDECYFAGDRVRIVILNIEYDSRFTTTISTMAVCEWVDKLNANIM